jgi:hypothetical protein
MQFGSVGLGPPFSYPQKQVVTPRALRISVLHDFDVTAVKECQIHVVNCPVLLKVVAIPHPLHNPHLVIPAQAGIHIP